jgi:hypothetical protein
MSVKNHAGRPIAPIHFEDEDPQMALACLRLESEANRYNGLIEQYLKSNEVSYQFLDVTFLVTKENKGFAIRISRDEGFNFHKKSWTLLSRKKHLKKEQLAFHFACEEVAILEESKL